MIAEPQGILNSGINFGRRCFRLSNAPSVLVGSAPSEIMAITRITVPKDYPNRPRRVDPNVRSRSACICGSSGRPKIGEPGLMESSFPSSAASAVPLASTIWRRVQLQSVPQRSILCTLTCHAEPSMRLQTRMKCIGSAIYNARREIGTM